jgi:hypothetical protein
MFTIQIDKFNIVTSLCDNDNIFITILNNINYKNYEMKCIKKDISNIMNINIFYLFLNKCLENIDRHECKIEIDVSNLYLTLSATVSDYIPIEHKLILKEVNSDNSHISNLKLNECFSKIKLLENQLIDCNKQLIDCNKQLSEYKKKCLFHTVIIIVVYIVIQTLKI